MSAIPVYTDMIFRGDDALRQVNSFQEEVSRICNEISRQQIQIPVMINADMAVINEFTARLQRDVSAAMSANPLPIPITIPDEAIQAAMDELRQQVQSADPIQIPVQYIPTNAPGGAAAAAGAGGGALPADGGAAAGEDEGGGFTDGMMSRRGAMGALVAVHGLNRLAETLDKELADYSDISDPEKQLAAKRKQIEEAHSGLRGFFNWAYSRIPDPITHEPGVLQPTYDQEMKEFNDAERQMKETEEREHTTKTKISVMDKMREEADRETDANEAFKSGSVEKQMALVNKALKKAQDTADKWLEQYPGGGADYDHAKGLVDSIKKQAQSLHDKAVQEIQEQDAAAVAHAAAEAKATNLRASGDATGAMRAQLEAKIAEQSRAAHKQSQAAGEVFDNQVAPGMRKELEEKITQRSQEIRGHESDAEASARERAEAAQSRAAGENEMAGALSRNRAIDDRMARLQRELSGEKDAEKRDSLSRQYSTQQKYAEQEKAANIEDAKRRQTEREQREANEQQRKEEAAAKRAKYETDTASRTAEERKERLARMNLDTKVYTLKSQGNDDEARRARIEGDADIEKMKYADDPEMIASITKRTNAQEAAIGVGKAIISHGYGDYLSHLQAGALTGGVMPEFHLAERHFGDSVDPFMSHWKDTHHFMAGSKAAHFAGIFAHPNAVAAKKRDPVIDAAIEKFSHMTDKNSQAAELILHALRGVVFGGN